MGLDANKQEQYIQILQEELIPALGCTEPIAIAFASARAAKILGRKPEKMVVKCSGNIIKNVKGVVVPNTGGMKGIEAAAVVGMLGGDSDKYLETLETVTQEDITRAQELLKDPAFCTTELLSGSANLHILVESMAGEDKAVVEVRDQHTNIVLEELNGKVLFKAEEAAPEAQPSQTDRTCLNVRDILQFADEVDLERVRGLISRQISYNTRISEEGLSHPYGANVGKTLLSVYGDDVKVRAKARAAAGSDARMSGCVLPVVINSGSGNQGMTVSLPVIAYAEDLGVSEEELYRALLVSNLISIHQKSKIGRLSAYCGAVSAACGSGAAITYMKHGGYQAVCDTITNTLANVSGIVCDGAKPSCAAKIASSVDAAILGHYMAMAQNAFQAGDGLVKEDIEGTMDNIGRLGKDGMKETDEEILHLMIER